MFRKSNPAIGARPGTLAIPEGSPPPKIHIVQYDPERVDRRTIGDPSELEAFRDPERVTWVDVQGLGDEAVLREIARVFELHPLALENAVNVPQRAKTDLYEDHQLVIARTPLLREDGRIEVPQVCFLIGRRTLVTFQERYLGLFTAVRERIENGLGRPIRREGPDYLAYALIDAMVDRYYPIAQRLSDRLETLEDLVVASPHPDVLARIHDIRRQLAVLRRVGWPQREALNAMLRERSEFITEPVKVYLRDTHDHIAQIVELIDSSREMASDLAESYLSNVSHRTNEIMKVLTLMASIFIPLTFVAGIYGMNFEHMPELHYRISYYVVLSVMVSIAAVMLLFFWRRGWIGGTAPPSDPDDDPPGTG